MGAQALVRASRYGQRVAVCPLSSRRGLGGAGLWAQGDKRNNARNGVPNVGVLLPTLLMLTQHRTQWRANNTRPYLFAQPRTPSISPTEIDLVALTNRFHTPDYVYGGGAID